MYLANNKHGEIRIYQVEDIEVVWDSPVQNATGSSILPHRKRLKVPRCWSFKMADGSTGRACVERTKAAAIAGVTV
jgi:hypothetical protein